MQSSHLKSIGSGNLETKYQVIATEASPISFDVRNMQSSHLKSNGSSNLEIKYQVIATEGGGYSLLLHVYFKETAVLTMIN